MVHIVPPAGWQTVSTEASVVQADSAVQPQPVDSTSAPTMEFVEASAPPAPVAATTVPLVLWGVGGGVLLLVGLAVGMWAEGKGAADDSPVAAVTDSKAEIEQPIVRDPYAVRPAAEETDTSTEAGAADPPVEPVAKTQANDPPATPELPALPAVQEDSVSVGAESAPTDEGEPRQTGGSASSEHRQPAILRFDPLDFDPTRLSLASGAASASAPSAGSIADDPAGAVDITPEAPLDETADNLLPPPRTESLHVRLGPAPSAASRASSAEQLALRVDSLDLSDIPLARFVVMVSDLTNVPITLDPMALELAGVAPLDAVSVQATDATLDSVLRDAFLARRLDFVEHDGQVRAVLRDGERRRSVDYEVKDLASGADASNVAELVARFVAPSMWRSAGGQGTVAVDGTKLRVEQTAAVHHELLIFCERLRLARGLPPRSRYPVERLSIESPSIPLAATLNERTTFTFLPWMRLRDVVDYWQGDSRLTILVDWSALADVELGPASPIACSAIDRPWEEAFDGILEPLELGWWAVDGKTIQITSRQALDAIRRVEFYTVPDGLREHFASEEAFVESLTTELRERVGGEGPASQSITLELDEASGRLIVLASPIGHRHLSGRLGGVTKQLSD